MKLHLGCGDKYIPGFFHVDAKPYPHIDHIGKVENLDFLSNNSVDLIYASHVLEHFDRTSYLMALAEWYRVLRKGGTLRVAVPDFEKASALYNRYGDITLVIGLVCGGQKTPFDFHNVIFDRASLGKSLSDVGFAKVQTYDSRKTDHSYIDDYSQTYLPHMNHADKENGILVSLNMEAFK